MRSKDWGAPLSYAANVGQLGAMQAIAGLGATDYQHALFRAVLQGHLDCASWLLGRGAKPTAGMVMGPCETLNGEGLSFLADAGTPFVDESGNRMAPLAMVLTTYSRDPAGKHACISVFERLGYQLPDTVLMAFHRGRLDLLERHLKRDPQVLTRRIPAAEIYPPDICGAGPEHGGMCGTPLDGGTLLHLAIDFDEQDIFEWLLSRGVDVNAQAAIDADGFGGHTPLFNAAVSCAYLCGRQRGAAMGRALLESGADPKHRASLRKFLDWIERPRWHKALTVTPLEWGETFPEDGWANSDLLALLSARHQAQ